MKNIAIFASGNGTNAERIIKYFKDKNIAQVSIVLTNNSNAGVIKKVRDLGVAIHIFNRSGFYNNNEVLDILARNNVELIVLAGFLWLIPEQLINKYPNKIINIHPALLPKHGGKGMYGMRVHETVIANGDSKSGITIHWVNKNYDEGQVIFQAEFAIVDNETPQSLAEKIHTLEYKHFPKEIENIIS